jgi:hypothetical protein
MAMSIIAMINKGVPVFDVVVVLKLWEKTMKEDAE